jgi:hypothetical protein
MGIVLTTCGLLAAGIGLWQGYANARLALAPLVHAGEPTRTAVEASRPPLARSRVRAFARRVGASVVWLIVAFYGLFLVSAGTVTG